MSGPDPVVSDLEAMAPAAVLAALTELRAEQINDGARDLGEDHRKADAILCRLLLHFGFSEIVSEWEAIDKWYE
jgi:hypothetical protein